MEDGVKKLILYAVMSLIYRKNFIQILDQKYITFPITENDFTFDKAYF